MDKKSTIKIIFWSVIASVLVNMFFSRWLTAKISTWPLLNRLNILSPQTPIVIKETQEIRISPQGEIGESLKTVRSRVSQLGVSSKDQFEVLGNVVNFTSDGLFVTSSLLLPSKTSGLQIRLPDGRAAAVLNVYLDSATGLTFLKAGLNNLPTGVLADSSALKLGDRILFFSDSAEGGKYFETQVNFLPEKTSGRPFGFQDAGVETRPGAVAANYKGEILGLWHNQLVAAEKIRSAFETYLNHDKK